RRAIPPVRSPCYTSRGFPHGIVQTSARHPERQPGRAARERGRPRADARAGDQRDGGGLARGPTGDGPGDGRREAGPEGARRTATAGAILATTCGESPAGRG